MIRVVWLKGEPGQARYLGEDDTLSADYAWDADNLWTAEMADHDWQRLRKLRPGTAKEFATEAEIAAAMTPTPVVVPVAEPVAEPRPTPSPPKARKRGARR